MRAGLELLASRNADDLSLREVARAVNVSATAVYRHFPDKRTLLKALAAEGLDRLSAAQHAASEAVGGGAPGFAATGRAYVRFALDNPALFRLIFANPSDAGRLLRDSDHVPEAMKFLRANAEAASTGVDSDVLALRAWSLAHGLAMLMLDGQVDGSEKIVASFFATFP